MTFIHRVLDQAHKPTLARAARLGLAATAAITMPFVASSAASAASASVSLSKSSNGLVTVKGTNFPKYASGTAYARISGSARAQSVKADGNGSFTATYTDMASMSGAADTYVKVGNVDARSATTVSKTSSSSTPTTAAKPGNVSAAAPAPATSAPSGWKLTFSDEFNGTKADESKWGLYDGVGNGGTAHRSRNNVSVANGALTIKGANNMAGGIGSKTSQTYGRWEVRAKTGKGAGYGSAILLWPSSENWPTDGELDLSEVVDANRTTSGSHAHWGANNTAIHHAESGDFSQWHTFAIDWLPDHLTYYIDGKAIWTITQRTAIPTTPHFVGIQLDTADGSYIKSGNSNVNMDIDYVRVYKQG